MNVREYGSPEMFVDTYKLVSGGRKIFKIQCWLYSGKNRFRKNNLLKILITFMLSPLLFLKCFGSCCRYRSYSQKKMLAVSIHYSTLPCKPFLTLYVRITTYGFLIHHISIHWKRKIAKKMLARPIITKFHLKHTNK